MKHQPVILLLMLMQFTAFSQKSENQAFGRAMHKMEMENYAAAISELDKVIAADSAYAEAFFRRGYCYAMLPEYEKALADLNRAIALSPNNGEWFYNRGIIHLNMGNIQDACPDLQTASGLGLRDADEMISVYCQ